MERISDDFVIILAIGKESTRHISARPSIVDALGWRLAHREFDERKSSNEWQLRSEERFYPSHSYANQTFNHHEGESLKKPPKFESETFWTFVNAKLDQITSTLERQFNRYQKTGWIDIWTSCFSSFNPISLLFHESLSIYAPERLLRRLLFPFLNSNFQLQAAHVRW